MWIAEFKVWHESSEVLRLTKTHDVTVLSIYLNVYKKGEETHISKVLAVNGPDTEKYIKQLLKTMERYRIHHAERNYIFFSIPQDAISYHTLILEERVFFIKPQMLKNGFEYWTVASWDKESIQRLYKKIDAVAERATIELTSLKQENTNLFIPDVMQRLSEQQFNVMQRAAEFGYYTYPRKINLKQLSKKLRLSESALREHLRLAEAKLVPVALQQFQRA
ncbi:helix-turn-helix domain-containing protein [Candidatus Micrarchaeota archaeon]|nr:helix-turn-helix domain-containing protein [Candidatus Micrarchaeota archaeon]